jgi:tetratricopeptide (TPR) repeat protein
VEFRVLGPVEVREDGRPLDLGGRRSRYVLGLLLLTGGLTSTETLIDGMWPHDPPRSARAQLHNMIGKLADAELRAGRLEDARAWLATCLRMHERLRNHEGVAWTLRSQSDVAVVEGRWADAVAGLERTLEIQLRIGEPLEIARTLDRLARALDEVGDPARAASHRTECAAILADRGLGEDWLDHPPRIR